MRKSRRKRRRRRRTRRRRRRTRRRRRRTRRRGAGKKRRKQPFQPWQGKHSFNDNLDNISHKSVESEGNFPGTTNGELSVEKTIEEQAPPLLDMGRIINSDNDSDLSDEGAQNNDYYFYSPNVDAVGDETLEELSKSEKLRREIADMNDVAADRPARRAKKGRWRDRARRAALAAIDYDYDPTREFKSSKPTSPWSREIKMDSETRASLEAEGRDPTLHGLADGLGEEGGRTVLTPAPFGGRDVDERLDVEESMRGVKEVMEWRKREEEGRRLDNERWARVAAAAAAKDPEVRKAANVAADEWDDEDLMFGLDMGGGRRKRRRRRRRTRKKRAGYGPIATGGWIPHNLLLPSQHLGSLGMWWT